MATKNRYVYLIGLLVLISFVSVYESYTLKSVQSTVLQSARVIELPLWNLDDNLSTVYASLISRAEGYRRIQIYHDNEELFVETPELLRENPVDLALAWVWLIRDMSISSPIFHQGQHIGRVDIVWVNYNIYTYFLVCLFLISLFYYWPLSPQIGTKP